VFVSVSRLGERAARKAAGHAKIAVYALGALNNPGKAEISAGTTLLQFLAQAGGFTKFAATKRIQLRRTDSATGQAEMFTFNFFALERGGRISGMIQLREGDVIVVPERRLFE
jgi:polysaccharide biosynthesis/export protein